MKRMRILALVAASVLTAGAGVAVAQGYNSGLSTESRPAAVKSQFQLVFGDTVTVQPGRTGSGTANCPSGMAAVSGLFSNDTGADQNPQSTLLSSVRGDSFWTTILRNPNTVPEQFTPEVVCTTP